jgi:hypothetical protein
MLLKGECFGFRNDTLLDPFSRKAEAMPFLGHIASALALCQGAYAAFGLTSTSTTFTVDTDAGLVFTVTK